MTTKKMEAFVLLLLLTFSGVSAPSRAGDNTPPDSGDLLDLSDEAKIAEIKPAQKASLSPGKEDGSPVLKVEFPAGEYPGAVFFCPPDGWNLSSYVGVEAEVLNAGTGKLNIGLRVDNPGDWKKEPWNTENVVIEPGDTKLIRVTFGKSYGNAGYALDPEHVIGIQVFATTPADSGVFLVKSLKAIK